MVLGHIEILHDGWVRDNQLRHGELVEEDHGILDGVEVSVFSHLAHEAICKPHAWVDQWLVLGVCSSLSIGHKVPNVAKYETTGTRVGNNSLLLIEPYSGQGSAMQVEQEQSEQEDWCEGDFEAQEDPI